MSEHASYHYAVENERRREIAKRRVQEATRTFAERYEQVLNQAHGQDWMRYVSTEHENLVRQVARVRDLLHADPFAARDLNVTLGAGIYSLRQLGQQRQRDAIEAKREAERLRVEELRRARDELESAWQEELTAWDDARSRSMAFGALADVRKALMSPDATTSIDQLREAVRAVRLEYERKAQERDQEVVLAGQSESRAQDLQLCRGRLNQATGLGADRVATLTGMLDSAEKLPPREVADFLATISEELDTAVDREACRREVVRGIYSTLEESGFSVQKPVRNKDDGHDEVVIRASRAAGAEAVFRVRLDGELDFKFDRYKGSACKQDIDKVLPRLQAAYGITLSDQRVLWENPDDRDEDARPIDPTTAGKGR